MEYERSVETLKFIEMCKLQIFNTGADDPIPTERYNLVAACNKYGYLYIGYDKGIKIFKTSELTQLNKVKNNKDTVYEYLHSAVPIGCMPQHLALSADGLTLSVCYRKDTALTLALYDGRTLIQSSAKAIAYASKVIGQGSDIWVMDLCWNPQNSTVLAACLSDGSLMLCDTSTGVKIVARMKDNDAKAICWSPEGKQLVAGKEDGSLVQYDLQLNEKRRIRKPDTFNGRVTVVDVCWVETYMFIAAYAEPNGQTNIVTVLAPPDNQYPTFANFENICVDIGHRQGHYYLRFIDKWEILLAIQSNGTEMVLMGKHPSYPNQWEIWNIDEDRRVVLPLKSNQQETFPLGVAIDMTSDLVQTGGRAAPIVVTLSTEGKLCPFYMIYEAECQDITSPPQALPEGQRQNPECVAVTKTKLESTNQSMPPVTFAPVVSSDTPNTTKATATQESSSAPLAFSDVQKSTSSASVPFEEMLKPSLPSTEKTAAAVDILDIAVVGSTMPENFKAQELLFSHQENRPIQDYTEDTEEVNSANLKWTFQKKLKHLFDLSERINNASILMSSIVSLDKISNEINVKEGELPLPKMETTRAEFASKKKDATPSQAQTTKINTDFTAKDTTVFEIIKQATDFKLLLTHTMLIIGKIKVTGGDLWTLIPPSAQTEKEVRILKERIPYYNEGWLTSTIIESYLWKLKMDKDKFFAATVFQLVDKHASTQKLWSDVNFEDIEILVIPINRNFHWTLFAVDAVHKLRFYFDPECPEERKFSNDAKSKISCLILDVSKLVESKTGWKCIDWPCIEPLHCYQQDTYNCGVFICLFARRLAENLNQRKVCSMIDERQLIASSVLGSCYSDAIGRNTEVCKVCHKDDGDDLLRCASCRQVFHKHCLGVNHDKILSQKFFCPL